jgi:hypothetical protein
MELRAKKELRHKIRGGEVLEVRRCLTVVASEYIFYNDSYFDGSNPAINSGDDNAIAGDKTAYKPQAAQSGDEVPADGQVTYGVGNNPAAPVWSRDQDPDGPATDQWTAVARIPTPLIVAPNGTILSFVELRNNWLNDANAYGFGLKLSTDNGSSWSEVIQLENRNPPTGTSTVRLALGASFVLPDGRVGLIYSYWTDWDATNNGGTVTMWEMYSNGTDYTSWTAPHEITSSVVKVNNSIPANMPAALDGTDSGWDYLLPTSAVTLSNGNVVVGAVYRYATDASDISRFATLQRDTSGNWRLLGGLADGDAGTHLNEPFRNMGVNESTMALDAFGHIRVMFRHKDVDQLYTSFSVDGGATWGGATPTAIMQSETQAAIVSNPNNRNEMFLATVNDSVRSEMTVFRSTNGGASWTGGSRVFYAGRSSYPGLQFMQDGRLILLYENTKDYGPYPHEYQYISQVRFTPADVLEPDSAIWYQFNERSSGPMLSGPSVFSQGMDVRAFGQAGWTYNSKGVVANGQVGLNLAQDISSTMGNAWADRQDTSFTAEVVADLTNVGNGAATQTILSNYNGSGKGWEIYTTAANRTAVAYITDNSGAGIIVTNPADLAAGAQPKAIALVFDKNSNTYTLYVNGVAGPAVANTEIGSLANSTYATLGARLDGSKPIAAGTVFHQVRLTRDLLVPSEMLTISTPKTPFSTYLGYTPPTLPSYAPSNNEHAKLWLGGLADGGINVSGDIGSALAPLTLPVHDGTGAGALTDAISGTLFKRGAPAEVVVDSDSTVGQYFHGNRTAVGGSAGLNTGVPSTQWDFIHETGVYTIVLGAFQFQSNTFTDQVLLTNSDKALANDGFTLMRLGNGKLLFTMTNDNVIWRTSYTTSKVFNNNTWYALAISSGGDGQPVNLYWAEWPGNMAMPANLNWEQAGIVGGDDVPLGSQPSQKPLGFGSASDGGLGTDWLFKDIMIFDVAMSPTEIMNTLQMTVWTPSSLATRNNITNYSRGINGIMVDLIDLPPGTTISANDFQFRIGNNNSPDTWAVAPAPTSVVVGVGQGGSDRVTITWANGAIKNTWLQVTLKGNDATGGFNTNTGLTRSDTFYFGNKIADSASTSGAKTFDTDSTDAAQVFASVGSGKAITDLRDYNRDGRVDSTDALLVFANVGNIVRLNLDPPAAAPLTASPASVIAGPVAPMLVAAMNQPALVFRSEIPATSLAFPMSGDAGIAAGLTISAEQSKRIVNQRAAEYPGEQQAVPALASPKTSEPVLWEGIHLRSHAAIPRAQLADAVLEGTEDLLDALLDR